MSMTPNRPAVRPARPFFSSGPCAKHPGWSLERLSGALLGRSHRSKPGMAKIRDILARTKALLRLPKDYRVAMVPASDTGAVELSMWALLGPKPVDVLVWESFGAEWMRDAIGQLKLPDTRVLKADYGELPDLHAVDPAHDVVFVWNGTTSGVRVPDGAWIAADREGLTICDATSAAFAMDLPWPKLDATCFSWQKVLGGEAAHGMLVLSPRAVERLESHEPAWPLPKIFRLTKDGKLHEGFFEGETLNTPSMLALEDYRDTLAWAESIGGLGALIARTNANFAALARWVRTSEWATFTAADERIRSTTSVCLKIVDRAFVRLPVSEQFTQVRRFAATLEEEDIAFDIASHRTAPPGLRIWCGATVETEDVTALAPWLDWAWNKLNA
ncbi:MAG TPA: phosphoserine transaminase [Rhizomicrobium sp.]